MGKCLRFLFRLVNITTLRGKRKTCLVNTKQVFWQREKDSNPHKQSQSLSCYPYTIPLFRGPLAEDSRYYNRWSEKVNPFFSDFFKKISGSLIYFPALV